MRQVLQCRNDHAAAAIVQLQVLLAALAVAAWACSICALTVDNMEAAAGHVAGVQKQYRISVIAGALTHAS
jgi:hypothetical protein